MSDARRAAKARERRFIAVGVTFSRGGLPKTYEEARAYCRPPDYRPHFFMPIRAWKWRKGYEAFVFVAHAAGVDRIRAYGTTKKKAIEAVSFSVRACMS